MPSLWRSRCFVRTSGVLCMPDAAVEARRPLFAFKQFASSPTKAELFRFFSASDEYQGFLLNLPFPLMLFRRAAA
jgi:hypothetical protein